MEGIPMLTTRLRSLKDLFGYGIQAFDGPVGKITDFLFDDQDWVVRYLVADTGRWLGGRKILLSPASFEEPDSSSRGFYVKLSKDTIENAPVTEADAVTRTQELALARYYNWPKYWGVATFDMSRRNAVMGPAYAATVEESQSARTVGPNLRSALEVLGAGIHAQDGDLGHVDDLVINDGDWGIRWLIADTGQWLPGKKVLLAPSWVRQIEWSRRKVDAGLTRAEIEHSPVYDFSMPVSREYEDELYDYYRKPKYWT